MDLFPGICKSDDQSLIAFCQISVLSLILFVSLIMIFIIIKLIQTYKSFYRYQIYKQQDFFSYICTRLKMNIESTICYYIGESFTVQFISFIIFPYGLFVLNPLGYIVAFANEDEPILDVYIAQTIILAMNFTLKVFLIIMIGTKIEYSLITEENLVSLNEFSNIISDKERRPYIYLLLQRSGIFGLLFIVINLLIGISFSYDTLLENNTDLKAYTIFMFIKNLALFNLSVRRFQILNHEDKIIEFRTEIRKRLNLKYCFKSYIESHLPDKKLIIKTIKNIKDISNLKYSLDKILEKLSPNPLHQLHEKLKILLNEKAIPVPINTRDSPLLSKIIILLFIIISGSQAISNLIYLVFEMPSLVWIDFGFYTLEITILPFLSHKFLTQKLFFGENPHRTFMSSVIEISENPCIN